MMPVTTVRPAKAPLRASDLRGLSRLGFDATVGITDLVEAMHHAIASRAGIVGRAPTGRTGGISGGVYRALRGTTRVIGQGLDGVLGTFTGARGADADAPQRAALLGALNGLWGDHLADTDNPLTVRMSLRSGGRVLDASAAALSAALPHPGRRLMVLVHGLCMSDLQWLRDGHDHGAAAARDLGYTPLYLNYNSGRHISQNGSEFAALLEVLVAQWPVPLDELVIVGHSMGGLVARSACHQAARDGQAWPRKLTRLVFLGTPHHGAPLERGGQVLDRVLELSPYLAPFARLGKARSAGITDLRFGNLHDADWQGRDRHAQRRDDRGPMPLPRGVDTYLLAATLAERAGRMHHAVAGDGLVPVASALGEHARSELALQVPGTHRHVVSRCGHLDLLSRPEVYAQLRRWLR